MSSNQKKINADEAAAAAKKEKSTRTDDASGGDDVRTDDMVLVDTKRSDVVMHKSILANKKEKNTILQHNTQWCAQVAKTMDGHAIVLRATQLSDGTTDVRAEDKMDFLKQPEKKFTALNQVLKKIGQLRATLRQEGLVASASGGDEDGNKGDESPLFHCLIEAFAYEFRGKILCYCREENRTAIDDLKAAVRIHQYYETSTEHDDAFTRYTDIRHCVSLWVALLDAYTGIIDDPQSTGPPEMEIFEGYISACTSLMKYLRDCRSGNPDAQRHADQLREIHKRGLVIRTGQKKLLLALTSEGGFARPIFSPQDRRDLEIIVGRPLFNLTRCTYVCAHCKTAGMFIYSTKTLSLCSGCHMAWYCGRDCQKAAWKDHKGVCQGRFNEFRPVVILPGEMKDRALYCMTRCLVFDYYGGDGRMMLIAKDPTTGGFFDVISDDDVMFKS